jgi:hypothetical protein
MYTIEELFIIVLSLIGASTLGIVISSAMFKSIRVIRRYNVGRNRKRKRKMK